LGALVGVEAVARGIGLGEELGRGCQPAGRSPLWNSCRSWVIPGVRLTACT
jgi:hypothetical protein